MHLSASDITIAVTVYRRLDYLHEALSSAVNQTVPVQVLLVDDGCQDLARLQAILAPFGSRVKYHRNPRSLGLFQNMNACIEMCTTPWLSVLHDDDRISENFVASLLAIAPEVVECALFFGQTVYIQPDGHSYHQTRAPFSGRWRPLQAADFVYTSPFSFPGQLMHVPTARACGGFPQNSLYTGDWDLWFALARARGAVQLSEPLGFHRVHFGADRGTTSAARSGRKIALCGMQAKRNASRVKSAGGSLFVFNRDEWLKHSSLMYRDLLVYAWKMPRWLLRYNRALLLRKRPPGRFSRLCQIVSRGGGTPALRLLSLSRHIAGQLGFKTPHPF